MYETADNPETTLGYQESQGDVKYKGHSNDRGVWWDDYVTRTVQQDATYKFFSKTQISPMPIKE